MAQNHGIAIPPVPGLGSGKGALLVDGVVRALTREEASAVLKDKILAKRVLRTRSCFRDKVKGLGPLGAKCRVVALGH